MNREEKAWRSLCGGKPAPKPVPATEPVIRPEPPDPHPERLTDPRWQRMPWRSGGALARLRREGKLDEQKLAAHFLACDRRSHSGPTDNATHTGLATSVGTPGYHPRSTPNPPQSLGSQPQATAIG